MARNGQGFLDFLCSPIALCICKRSVIEYDIEVYELRSSREKVIWKQLFVISDNTES